MNRSVPIVGYNRQNRMRKTRDLYVRQLRADAEGLLEQAQMLENNYIEDFDDHASIILQLPYIEEIGAEVNELWEHISVLAQDLNTYLEDEKYEIEHQHEQS